VRVSLKSVSGVDSVDVSLEKGLATVKMKPGNIVTLKQLSQAISKNGFTMKESAAIISGTVVVTNGKSRLQVSGSNEMLELLPNSSATPAATLLNGKSVLVDGVIPEAGKGKSPDSIRYQSIKEENSR
jgi:flagellar hook assembly protein FlgD